MKDTPQKHQTKKDLGGKSWPTEYSGSGLSARQQHIPVLAQHVLNVLDPKGKDRFLDLTAGYGGHADLILERTFNHQQSSLVDRDQNAIDQLRIKYEGFGVEILHGDFETMAEQLKSAGKQFDIILADLGVSSPHLDNAERGFSLKAEGPLDMRMDQTQSAKAADLVNNLDGPGLADIIWRYGEEPMSKRIARAIVASRPISTTTQLAGIVAGAKPRGKAKVHPATKTFQALRIAVNDELGLLERALPIWLDLLAPGGRIAVISFHSLEDRIVKQFFAEHAGNRYDAVLKLLGKQPITADADEIVYNPRARSAKLRAAVKK